MLNIPEFDNPADAIDVEDFLASIAENFNPLHALSALDSLWPEVDKDGEVTNGFSPEAFAYISRVIHAAHSNPSVLKPFLRTRTAAQNVVPICENIGIAVGQ